MNSKIVKLYTLLFLICLAGLMQCKKPTCPPSDDDIPVNECTPISSWSARTSTVSSLLSFVEFSHKDTGYVAGYDGVMLKTEDGGASFQQLSLGTSEDVNAMKFVNSKIGYVATNIRTLSSGSTHFYKTVDGGQNFTALNTGVPMYFRSLCFLDSLRGFGGGGGYPFQPAGGDGKLIKTIDGGNSWTLISVAGMECPYKICFIDDMKGFMCGSNGQIHKTTDGGNSWTLIPLSIGAVTATSNILLSDINFISPTVGFCIGFSRVYDENFILKTTDGGDTWTRITSPSSGFATWDYFGKIRFSTDKIGYISGGNTANNYGKVFKTIDGGNTWSEIPTSTPFLIGISLVDCKTSYIVGDNGTILKSE